jgi:hypothetical protein
MGNVKSQEAACCGGFGDLNIMDVISHSLPDGLDESVDLIRFAFDDQLDPAVIKVLHEADDLIVAGKPNGCIAETHSLYMPGEVGGLLNDHGRHLRVRFLVLDFRLTTVPPRQVTSDLKSQILNLRSPHG